jgi:CSLREA domain-containing protein
MEATTMDGSDSTASACVPWRLLPGARRATPARLLVVLACAAAVLLAGAGSASAATYIVTSVDDADDGACDGPHCSLREAILATNAATGPDRILFNDDETITPATPLPAITDTTHINSFEDGRCASDSAPASLDGNSADFSGLVFEPGSDSSRVCLVNVRGFENGIEFRSSHNEIRISTIGTSPNGMSADPNANIGILVTGDHNVIGGEQNIKTNVISGNALYGVFVGEATGTEIAGNLIGTDWSTGTAIPNGIGVYVDDGATDTTVGGTGPRMGNVISGNILNGVSAGDGRVVGNHIGVDFAGTEAVPNGEIGVQAFGPVQIGGRTAEERNVISGHPIANLLLNAAATVEGNWIGPAADGSDLDGDSFGFGQIHGIRLLSGADGAVIGGAEDGAGNVIAGQFVSVESSAPLSGLVVQGNLIGLAPDGRTPIPTDVGILIGEGATDAQVGGTEDGAGNTVVGLEDGIAVAGDRARIEGNTVGLDEDGTVSDAAEAAGVDVRGTADRTTIGGDSAAAGNTISGNLSGIHLDSGSTDTVVQGNLIGTDPTGAAERANVVGVDIREGAEVQIGGTRPGQRNVISGNSEAGVYAGSATGRVAVEGNLIGVAADGVTPLGNLLGVAIGRFSPVPPSPSPGEGFAIGGTAAGAGNTIAHNDGDGVSVLYTSDGVTILGNAIFANGVREDPGGIYELGIDLLDDGVSANDPRDRDDLPNFPVLTRIDTVAVGSIIQGTIDNPAGHEVRIELFASPSCDQSGHGQAQTMLGTLTMTAPGVPAAFSARVDTAPAGYAVTATATDLTTNRTSEFSACGAAPDAPGPPAPPEDPPPPEPPEEDPPGTEAPSNPTGTTPAGGPAPRPCKVPKLAGLTLAKAKQRLKRAGCRLGKVTKPGRRRRNGYRLVVKSTSLRPGPIREGGTAVRLTLEWKRVKPRRR